MIFIIFGNYLYNFLQYINFILHQIYFYLILNIFVENILVLSIVNIILNYFLLNFL